MMTRPRILLIVSALTVLVGLSGIWSFLSPMVNPNELNDLDLNALIYGTVSLLVGWGLFRRNEFALEISFWLWFLSLVGLGLRAALLLAEISDFTVFRNILGVVLLGILFSVYLFVVIFLSQKETKRLFVSDSTEKTEVKSE